MGWSCPLPQWGPWGVSPPVPWGGQGLWDWCSWCSHALLAFTFVCSKGL